MQGVIAVVSAGPLGDELAADAAAGTTTLVVDDAAQFAEEGGTLCLGYGDPAAQVIDYAAVDDDSGTLTLVVPTTAAWPATTPVVIWDPGTDGAAVEWRAEVIPPDDLGGSEPIDALVHYTMVPLLQEGIRADGEGEVVVLEQDGAEWVVTNVRGRTPQIRGDLLAPGSVVPESLGFTFESGTKATISATAPDSPNVGDLWFDASNGYVLKQWDGSTWHAYQLGSGALAAGSIPRTALSFTINDQTTTLGAAPASPKVGDIWLDSANGYRINQWTGSAWTPVAFSSAALADGSVIAAKIATGAVIAGKIAADAITANEIAANAVTASELAANAVTAGKIDALAVTARELAANSVIAGKILAGTITATEIAARTITADRILAGALTATEIAARSLTADRIVAGTLTATEIAARSLTADRIVAGDITGTEIHAGAVTADHLDVTALVAASIVAGNFSGTISGSSSAPTSILNALIDGCAFYVDDSNGALLIYSAPGVGATTTYSANGTWTCPAGITSVTVEATGAGGGGASGLGAGGGGGEYAASKSVAVTPGAVYTVAVGAGGAGGAGSGGVAGVAQAGSAGGDSTFSDASANVLVRAHGGKGGVAATGGAGGTAATTPIHFNGGKGGTGGAANTGSAALGAGGGSSAGSSAAGNGGTGTTGGAAPTGGGAGGTPVSGATGGSGAAPGGGGAGGGSGAGSVQYGGGSGARGQVKLTTASGAGILIGSISQATGTDAYGNTIPAGVFLPLNSRSNITDLNLLTTPGRYYAVSTTANLPSTANYQVEVYSSAPATSTSLQLAYRVGTGDSAEAWIRQWSSTNGWQPWHQVYGDSGAISTPITATSPHTVSGTVRRVGAVVQFQAVFTLGAAITVPSNGDIGNTELGTIATGYRPGQTASVTSAGTGPVTHGQVTTAGSVQVTAIAPGATLASGTQVQLAGTFLAA